MEAWSVLLYSFVAFVLLAAFIQDTAVLVLYAKRSALVVKATPALVVTIAMTGGIWCVVSVTLWVLDLTCTSYSEYNCVTLVKVIEMLLVIRFAVLNINQWTQVLYVSARLLALKFPLRYTVSITRKVEVTCCFILCLVSASSGLIMHFVYNGCIYKAETFCVVSYVGIAIPGPISFLLLICALWELYKARRSNRLFETNDVFCSRARRDRKALLVSALASFFTSLGMPTLYVYWTLLDLNIIPRAAYAQVSADVFYTINALGLLLEPWAFAFYRREIMRHICVSEKRRYVLLPLKAYTVVNFQVLQVLGEYTLEDDDYYESTFVQKASLPRRRSHKDATRDHRSYNYNKHAK